MDSNLISVLYNQAAQGNKGEGDWKPQAYQAVVDEINNKLSMSLNTDHERNRVKIWKKHYAIIMDIRTKTKFKYHESIFCWLVYQLVKFIDFQGLKSYQFCSFELLSTINPAATSYSNKFIKHWDDICVLVGLDRAVGDGAEHHEEGADRMNEETCDGESSSVDTTTTSSRKKPKRDQLVEAVTSFADSFKDYVETKAKSTPPLSGKEVYEEVSKVYDILPNQVLRAFKILMGSPQNFQMLMDLPEDQKLEWILLCLDDSSY
ncbi:hypothetical protein RND81_01G167500 [Saponaria officinalis]|uniref:Myb/SANT-like domain-containing protein n=1 Tax=Saponaria officinalis TaxID=3572 RepID=A0AAW1NHR8_SAPOF